MPGVVFQLSTLGASATCGFADVTWEIIDDGMYPEDAANGPFVWPGGAFGVGGVGALAFGASGFAWAPVYRADPNAAKRSIAVGGAFGAMFSLFCCAAAGVPLANDA